MHLLQTQIWHSTHVVKHVWLVLRRNSGISNLFIIPSLWFLKVLFSSHISFVLYLLTVVVVLVNRNRCYVIVNCCYIIVIGCYYKHTAFSWGCYGRLPHEGKNITLEVEGDILLPECDIFSRVWSSTITPSTNGSMFLLYWMPVVKRTFNFYWCQLTNGTHYVHITT